MAVRQGCKIILVVRLPCRRFRSHFPIVLRLNLLETVIDTLFARSVTCPKYMCPHPHTQIGASLV